MHHKLVMISATYIAGFLLLFTAQPAAAQDGSTVYFPLVATAIQIDNPDELLDPICNGDICTVEVTAPLVAAGECAYVAEQDLSSPIVFRVPRAIITTVTPNADFSTDGDLTVRIGDQEFILAAAELTFARGSAGLGKFERVRGRVRFPTSLYEQAGFGLIDDEVEAQFGLDRGLNLTDLDVPVCENLQYLFFTLAATRTVRVDAPGAGKVTYELGAQSIFLADPLDRSFQLQLQVPLAGTGGMGISQQGLLPYEPQTVWKLENSLKGFTGHAYNNVQDLDITNKFGIPLSLSGFLLIDGDPDGDTPPYTLLELANLALSPVNPLGMIDFDDLTSGRDLDRQWGVNGEMALTLPVVGDLDSETFGQNLFDIDLGEAGIGLKLGKDQQQLYFSGMTIQPPSYPLAVLQPRGTGRMSGYLSDQLTDFEFNGEGQFDLVPNELIQLPQFPLSPLVVTGTATTNIDGIIFSGSTTSQIHPAVVFDGAAAVGANIPFSDPTLAAFLLSGDMSLPAAGITGNADLLMDPLGGMRANGTFAIRPQRFEDLTGVPLNLIDLDGIIRIQPDGFAIQGHSSSQIHPQINLGNAEIDGFISTTDPTASYLKITGKMTVAGVDLGAGASLDISQSGIAIAGEYARSVNNVKLSGSVTTAGIAMSGSIGLSIDISTPAVPGKLRFGACTPALPGENTDCTLIPAAQVGEMLAQINLSLANTGLSGGAGVEFCDTSNDCQALDADLVLGNDPAVCATVPIINKRTCIQI